jgi:hypothetical protein
LRAQTTAFKADDFAALIREAHARHLSCHPLLTPERVAQYADQVRDPRFGAIFRKSVEEVQDAERFRGYLRSLVLHGLALSLQDLFVIHGRGDERQVQLHARLPIQFGARADDTLTVFEGGDHGDGTARTFLKHLDEAFGAWRRGELADCPYAAEDALLELLFEHEGRHSAWRALDPHDPQTLPRIGRELTGTSAVAEAHLQVLRRALFQAESVGADRFELYPLLCEIRAVRARLEVRLQRQPGAWELVSAAVRAAGEGSAETPSLAALLDAYRRLGADSQRGAPGAAARLADQVYRLSASLCVDGCRGCLHRSSSLMSDALTTVAVSRDLLRRYREFVLEPLTIRVRTAESGQLAADAERLVQEHGLCRLLVDPAVYDRLRQELQRLSFTDGVFDPLLLQVVCVRLP